MHKHGARITVLLVALSVASAGFVGAAIAWGNQFGSPSSSAPPPNRPAVVDSGSQPPAEPPGSLPITPTPPSIPPVEAGRLTRLSAGLDTSAWAAVSRAGYRLRGAMPRTYTANFSQYNMLDGNTPTEEITFSSLDPKAATPRGEGSWPTDGRTWLTATLYQKGSPGFMAQPEGATVDSVEVTVNAGKSIVRVAHWKRSDGAPDAVLVGAQIPLADGRLLVLSGGTLSPSSDEAVRALLGLISTLGVQ